MDERTRHAILEGPLPEKLRLRHLFGAALSVWLISTFVLGVVFLTVGSPQPHAVQAAATYSVLVADVVVGFMWLWPVLSMCIESLARRRFNAGAFRRVSTCWSATYGMAIVGFGWPPLERIPAVLHFSEQRQLHGFENGANFIFLVIIGGFVIGWFARLVILSLSDERPAKQVFHDLPTVATPRFDLLPDQYEPLKVPQWPTS